MRTMVDWKPICTLFYDLSGKAPQEPDILTTFPGRCEVLDLISVEVSQPAASIWWAFSRNDEKIWEFVDLY